MKNIKTVIAAALCAGLGLSFAAVTVNAGAVETEESSVTEEYTGTLPVEATAVTTTTAVTDNEKELQKLREKGERMVGEYTRQEKVLLGELDADTPRITLEEAENIIEESGSFREIMKKVMDICKYPDYNGGSGLSITEFWLNDSGSCKLMFVVGNFEQIVYIDRTYLGNTKEFKYLYNSKETKAEVPVNSGLLTYKVYNDILPGDVNGDGDLNVADVVMLQRWVIGASDDLTDWQLGNVVEDDRLDTFDLCLLKRMVVEYMRDRDQ
jgi:hypothetical protein